MFTPINSLRGLFGLLALIDIYSLYIFAINGYAFTPAFVIEACIIAGSAYLALRVHKLLPKYKRKIIYAVVGVWIYWLVGVVYNFYYLSKIKPVFVGADPVASLVTLFGTVLLTSLIPIGVLYAIKRATTHLDSEAHKKEFKKSMIYWAIVLVVLVFFIIALKMMS